MSATLEKCIKKKKNKETEGINKVLHAKVVFEPNL